MEKFNKEIQTAHKILMSAIESRTICIVEIRSNSVSLSTYQDKVGIFNRIELYMSNYSNIDGRTGLSIIGVGGESLGSCFIDWNKVHNISILRHFERIHLKIDDLSFNFTEKIISYDTNL